MTIEPYRRIQLHDRVGGFGSLFFIARIDQRPEGTHRFGESFGLALGVEYREPAAVALPVVRGLRLRGSCLDIATLERALHAAHRAALTHLRRVVRRHGSAQTRRGRHHVFHLFASVHPLSAHTPWGRSRRKAGTSSHRLHHHTHAASRSRQRVGCTCNLRPLPDMNDDAPAASDTDRVLTQHKLVAPDP